MVKNNPVFVLLDTNVLVALYNQKDSLHLRALKVFQVLHKQEARLVVSNYVLAELYTILSQRAGKKSALKLGKIIRQQKPFVIKRIDERLEESSWQIFSQISDKNVSYIDCSLIALVVDTEYQLLTFDQKIIILQNKFKYLIFTP